MSSSTNPRIGLPTLEQVIDANPLTVEPNTPAITAIALLSQPPGRNNFPADSKFPLHPTQPLRNQNRCILVIEAAKPIGILTAQDIVKLVGSGIDLSSFKVAEVMTQPIKTLSQAKAHNLLTAWSMLRKYQIHYLPIVNDQGELLGLVTQDNLLQEFDPLAEMAAHSTPQSIRELQSELHNSQRHELELLGDRNRLEAFFSQSPDGFFFMMLDCPIQWNDAVDQDSVLDYVFKHQRVTKVNASMLAQYEATEDEFLDLTPQDFFAHDLETGRQLWREMFNKGRLHVETAERKLDGTSMWIEGDYNCLYNSDGEIIGHFGIQRNISNRKQAEEALRQSQQELTDFVENAIVCLHWVASDGTIIWANQAELDLLGYTREEYIGHSITEFHADQVIIGDILQRLLSNQPVQDYEAALRCKDGSIRYVMIDSNSSWSNGKFVRTRCFTRDITDRKCAEAALRQSEQRFRAIFDGTFQFIGLLTPEGSLIEANRPALDAIAAQLDDVVGKPFWETPWWIHSHGLQVQLKEAIARAATGELVRFEAEHILADGKSISVDFSLKPVFDDAGKVVMLIPEGRDISDQKHASTALQESEERLQALIDNAGSVIYIKNPQGEYSLINHQYETLFHLEREAIKGKTDHDIFPKDIADAFRANDLEVIALGIPVESEEIAPQDDGLHTYLTIKFPLLDSEGKINAVCGISTDISDRKRAEVQLRQQEAFLKSIYDGTEQAIFVVDVAANGELRYTNFNPVSEKYAGVANAQIQGKTPKEAFGETLGSILQQNYEQCLQTGNSMSYEEQLNFESHSIWTLTTLVPLRNDQDQIYRIIGTATDISDRKKAELELQQQKQDLARSNDELQQFAYVASHDLQEPLRMITSYLELLERRYKGQLDEKADQFIAYAVDGAARMQILINDLLKYSRVGSRGQSFERVDGGVVLQNALRNLQVAITESNTIITHDLLPEVNADTTQLTQLFQNLISNAIKFHGQDPPQIHIGVERTKGKWLFSVRDNGIGIESQYINRIFVIFQRLHSRKEYPGTGMGLAICKKIVERHGGILWVESQLGEGSTFYFTLPDAGVGLS